MKGLLIMSASQFKGALTREIERRTWKRKTVSIHKNKLAYWIQLKMTYDLENRPMVVSFTLFNGKRGKAECYSDVEFTDEIMELVYKLYDMSK